MRQRLRALGTALAATAAVCAAAPGSAFALGASVSGGVMNVSAGGGEANDVDITQFGSQYVVTDRGAGVPVWSGSGCSDGFSDRVVCPTAMVSSISVDTGDSNDSVTVWVPVASNLQGGSGDDVLAGGGASDTLSGGPGNDTLGGFGGADTMIGGSDTDQVTYASRSAPVSVDLDGAADDGELGENDDVRTDVEDVTGGGGDDTLSGNEGPNSLDGGNGADTVEGGEGQDVLAGGAGADQMRSRDDAPDQVGCGADADSVTSDVSDAVGADCEANDLGQDAVPEPPPAPEPPSPPDPPKPSKEAPNDAPAKPKAAQEEPIEIGDKPITVTQAGVVRIPLRCQLRRRGRCSATVTLYLLGSRARVRSARRRGGGTVLGRTEVSLPAGKTVRVKVRLSRNGRRRVLRRRKVRCRVSATVRAPDGTTTTTDATVTLRAPKRGRHRAGGKKR